MFLLAVQPGDVVVMGSDGLLDNCRLDEIVRLAPREASGVQAAAAALAALAREHAGDPDYESPYTQDALEEGIDLPLLDKLLKSSFKGGKFQLGKVRGRPPRARTPAWPGWLAACLPACLAGWLAGWLVRVMSSRAALHSESPRLLADQFFFCRHATRAAADRRQDGRHHRRRGVCGGGGMIPARPYAVFSEIL